MINEWHRCPITAIRSCDWTALIGNLRHGIHYVKKSCKEQITNGNFFIIDKISGKRVEESNELGP